MRRILAEALTVPREPLAALVRVRGAAPAAAVVARAARAVLDLDALPPLPPPAFLAPHQVPAWERLRAIIARWGGAVLADAPGLGKSYVALATALAAGPGFALVLPAVIAAQWRDVLARTGAADACRALLTHERLSRGRADALDAAAAPLLVVDEAHHFRNPATRRYRALAGLALGRRVLLVTATPVHNRPGDLLHLLRLFLRDDALACLGVASLRKAAQGDAAAIGAVVPRLVVARSRHRAAAHAPPRALAFPARRPGTVIRAGTAPAETLERILSGIAGLPAAGVAHALTRLVLLRRLASSVPAFRATLERLIAFADFTRDAAAGGRALDARTFARLFPRGDEGEIQLTLLPLVLAPGGAAAPVPDAAAVRALRDIARPGADPKADALAALLASRPVRTVVFTESRATVRHLLRRLARSGGVAGIVGAHALLPGWRVPREELLRLFAPAPPGPGAARTPPAALALRVLVATDLLSEGLNLQGASRVVHYDLPWSPARLAQRVGRIDRLGAPGRLIETVSFAPPEPLERALGVERRMAAKLRLQRDAGAAAREAPAGAVGSAAPLDWCDALQAFAAPAPANEGSACVVVGAADATVLAVRIGAATDLFVVDARGASAHPARAAALLAVAAGAPASDAAPGAGSADADFAPALARAAPLVRARVETLLAARWRAADRDAPGRRLAGILLEEARRAARARDTRRLAALDAALARLTRGLTAGEEEALAQRLDARASVTAAALLEWAAGVGAPGGADAAPEVALVAAVRIVTRPVSFPACPSRRSSSTSTAPSSTPSS